MTSMINYLLFINIFNLQHFFSYKLRFLDVCGVKTTKIGCNSSSTTTLNTLWYVCSTIFFRKLLFSWIEFDDFFFIFHETYNNQLRERYGDDPLTHPCFDLDFWMEARLSGGPIEIGCTDSPTLRPRTCERPIVSQPLGALNRYRAPRLRNSWLCNNTWLISPKDMSNSRQIMNNSA